jgi:hypothetical protein
MAEPLRWVSLLLQAGWLCVGFVVLAHGWIHNDLREVVLASAVLLDVSLGTRIQVIEDRLSRKREG